MKIGAIADDLTGATDLALILSRAGFSVLQVVGVPDGGDLGDADAVVVSLKSRTIPAAEAVEQSLAAGRALLAAGAQQLYFKYCSTFDSTDDGNIGPVTDALLDLVGARGTIACPAFPANGRTIYQGHLFVGDRLLSESSMRDHPLTPMRDADLVRVLGRQSTRDVSLIALPAVRAKNLDERFAAIDGIAIVDAVEDADLMKIGQAASGLKLVTGGSGAAMGLPANFGAVPGQAPKLDWPSGKGVVLAGSCSKATLGQVQHYKSLGAVALGVDPVSINAGKVTLDQAEAFVRDNGGDLPPLVYSSAAPDAVAEQQKQLGTMAAGEIVERFLAELAGRLKAAGFTRFVVAGGETSGAVVGGLGMRALQIGPEIDPGVPWTRASSDNGHLALALKSGNFGAVDFFSKAWDLLS
ncbi:MAG: 3-oxo-tetronate kinase [Devosia sp.]